MGGGLSTDSTDMFLAGVVGDYYNADGAHAEAYAGDGGDEDRIILNIGGMEIRLALNATSSEEDGFTWISFPSSAGEVSFKVDGESITSLYFNEEEWFKSAPSTEEESGSLLGAIAVILLSTLSHLLFLPINPCLPSPKEIPFFFSSLL